jgi:hypothetical protein
MRHLDEGTIHAWLDGALNSDEAARAEAHVASCSVCADAVAEARGLIAASSRILLALDDVPNVKGARGAEGARWGRRSLATWLVRERIAAVLTLVVAGGALAVAVSRNAPREAALQLASEPARAFEVTAADSPAPPTVAAPEPQKKVQTLRDMGGRGAAASSSRARDAAVARQADSAPGRVFAHVEVMPTEAAAAPPVRTDDTLRSITIAQAQRENVQELSTEAKSSVGEKLADVLPRRRAAAESPARFAEPRAAAPGIGGVAGGAARTGDPRLVQEERMTESGGEVRRRIYRVDGILVTLDERPSGLELEERRPRAEANAAVAPPPVQAAPAPADSTAGSTNTIRWTDARGNELTLTGPASPARLERIRKLLGY